MYGTKYSEKNFFLLFVTFNIEKENKIIFYEDIKFLLNIVNFIDKSF